MNRIVLILPLLAACGGTGTIEVNVYGEDFIEQEIPAASAPGEEGLVDGFKVEYDKFLVALANLEVANSDDEVAATDAATRIWDVKKPGPHAVAQLDAPAERWDRVSVEMRRASGATAGNADAADVDMMNAGGHTVIATGRVSNETDTYTFDWRFDTETLYADCVDADERPGVNVPTGGSVPMQLTIHGDHLFYDDLQSDDPSLRFAAMAAADTNGDFDVTLEELAAVDLTSLPSDQYGTGGDPDVNDLSEFVTALTRTLVHFQGEGHCVQIKR